MFHSNLVLTEQQANYSLPCNQTVGVVVQATSRDQLLHHAVVHVILVLDQIILTQKCQQNVLHVLKICGVTILFLAILIV